MPSKKTIKMISKNSFTTTIAIIVFATIQIGCDTDQIASRKKTDFLDSSIEQLHSLGWLGGRSHPLADSLKIDDPDVEGKEISPGGIVIASVHDDGPMSKAGIKSGDVILRIAADWVPIKEDPTLDLIRLVERQISAEKQQIDLGIYREGNFQTVIVETDLQSIDEGLPLPTQRFTDVATNGLNFLARQQNEDGSIGKVATEEGQCINTALAGLAFLAADESAGDQYESNANLVVEYFKKTLGPEDLNLDPLTASYIGLFLAESDVDMMDMDWLDRISKLTEIFETSQHQSGGWNVTEFAQAVEADVDDVSKKETTENDDGESEQPMADIVGTYTTNQVLLAIGALERKGFSGEADTIEKAIGYLHDQNKLRVPAPIDRRIKAALSAGTAAAMLALNCDRNDVQLREYLKTALQRSHDMHTSPALALPGLLHLAMACRQLGNESWLQFYDATKYLAVAIGSADGSSIEYPMIKRKRLDFESDAFGDTWRTAHFSLIQSIQSKQLTRVLAIDAPPMLVNRDGNGKKSETIGDQGGPGPGGVQVIKIDGAAGSDEIKKMIMERLKEQGMEVDESKIKIGGAKKK